MKLSQVLIFFAVIAVIATALVLVKKSVPPVAIPQESSEPKAAIFIISPQTHEKISSPLTVTGVVEPGWMFEGVFPIKLLDNNKNIITQGLAREITPGSWQSGKEVEFSATLTFTTTVKTGFLVLEKDNPSGLPENAKSIEMPINFK